MRDKSFVWISNVEYTFLILEGGDPLIALFATLRFFKKGTVYHREGRYGCIGLLKSITGLSRTVLEKYLPGLLKTGLVEVHLNGNIAVRSWRWSGNPLPSQSCQKLIPIQIGPKFTDTKDYVAFVRVHSNILKQKSRIGRKAEQIEILREGLQGKTRTLADYKRTERLLRQGGLDALNSKYLSISTISNLGFYKLLKGSEGSTDTHRRIGANFKIKLIRRGLIQQNRIVRRVSTLKSEVGIEVLEEELKYGGYFLGRLGIYYETSPEIDLTISPYSR